MSSSMRALYLISETLCVINCILNAVNQTLCVLKCPLTQETSLIQSGFDLSPETFFSFVVSFFYSKQKSLAVVFKAKRGWDVGLNGSSACALRTLFQIWCSLGGVEEQTCSGSGVKMQQLIFGSSGRGGKAPVCRAARNMSSLLSVTYQLKSQFAPDAFMPPQTQIWCDS